MSRGEHGKSSHHEKNSSVPQYESISCAFRALRIVRHRTTRNRFRSGNVFLTLTEQAFPGRFLPIAHPAEMAGWAVFSFCQDGRLPKWRQVPYTHRDTKSQNRHPQHYSCSRTACSVAPQDLLGKAWSVANFCGRLSATIQWFNETSSHLGSCVARYVSAST